MSKKQNQCYIPVLQGELAFISPDYYELKIMYQLDNMQVCCRSIWLNQLDKIEGVKYQYGCFSRDGLLACLALENVLSLYRGD